MLILPYAEEDAAQWDELVARAPMATFLHTRRYLAYHGDKFKDESLLIRDDRGRLVGLFPAAASLTRPGQVSSHPGITYGGVLHDGELNGDRMLAALREVRCFYAGRGFDTLLYKAVPHIYHLGPSADDLYALFRLGAVRRRCQLSCTIDLACRRPVSSRRRRSLKRALKHGVRVEEGEQFLAPLWVVVEENLLRKYGARPVHTVGEMTRLCALFPSAIKVVVALLDSEVVAGALLFVTPRVVHAQYIASSLKGYEVNALDAVFEDCIADAAAGPARFFDFGTSNEQDGRLNADLYQFKAEFGGGGVAHEIYEINLREPESDGSPHER
jgi:hypothetical protein